MKLNVLNWVSDTRLFEGVVLIVVHGDWRYGNVSCGVVSKYYKLY
jgi:hypothetical protein